MAQTIVISNNFDFFGYAELVFNKNGITKLDSTNLKYDNLMIVFNHLTGGVCEKLRPISSWEEIIKKANEYNTATVAENSKSFGTFRGNPEHDEWASFHDAPNVEIK